LKNIYLCALFRSRSRSKNLVAILVYCGSSENQVTAVTLAFQKLCAIIAYNDTAAEDTTWTGRGRGEKTTCKQEDL
jgi:hypothetical protein